MPDQQQSKLMQKCKQGIYWRSVNVISPFRGENKLIRNLNHQIIKTSLKIHGKIVKDVKNTKFLENRNFNTDAVLVEIIIFMVCFTQAGLKRSLHDLWDVPAFKSKLQAPVMKTGQVIIEKLVSPNYYDPLQNPTSIHLVRISEYFKKDGIDKFISNLAGAVLQGHLSPDYDYERNSDAQQLQASFKNGLGKILADHDIANIKIAGKSA
ncbi:MAG: hypothetical protein GC137_10345 [Alphaproteobacteria bacterium]|nr:hypothetical protein [Alphaproteobacteria bacterium]